MAHMTAPSASFDAAATRKATTRQQRLLGAKLARLMLRGKARHQERLMLDADVRVYVRRQTVSEAGLGGVDGQNGAIVRRCSSEAA